MTSDMETKDAGDLELLLPWYVNGTLDAADARRIEAALPGSPRLAASLAALVEDRDAAIALAEAIDAPVSMEARFMAQLAAGPARSPVRPSTAEGPMARLGRWCADLAASIAPQRLALAAAVAVALVVAQAGVIAALWGGAGQGQFRTATGDAPAAAGITALVRFAPAASIETIGGWLVEAHGRIDDGPLPGGFYRLRFAGTDVAARDMLVDRMRARPDLFATVLPGG